MRVQTVDRPQKPVQGCASSPSSRYGTMVGQNLASKASASHHFRCTVYGRTLVGRRL